MYNTHRRFIHKGPLDLKSIGKSGNGSIGIDHRAYAVKILQSEVFWPLLGLSIPPPGGGGGHLRIKLHKKKISCIRKKH